MGRAVALAAKHGTGRGTDRKAYFFGGYRRQEVYYDIADIS